MTSLVRALIVDDSAFVRKSVRDMLLHCPFIEVVGMARNGQEALGLVEELKPDVVTCDLSMPEGDGLSFVRAQMARRPLPIIVLTASPREGEQVLAALEAGAFDVVQKPTALASAELLDIRGQLIDSVKAAAGAVIHPLPRVPAAAPIGSRAAGTLRADVLLLGVSTGGPQALRYLLPQFPSDFPVPIVMVLHMPVGYTALFAEKLNELSQVQVEEAKQGSILRPGTALLAPAGRHLVFHRAAGAASAVSVQLTNRPSHKPHKPSVDVMFRSAAEAFGGRTLAVVMTGMGDDGKEGAAWIKAQGGFVLTESEESCIIYGMPRSVVEAGLSDRSCPLDRMAEAIMNCL